MTSFVRYRKTLDSFGYYCVSPHQGSGYDIIVGTVGYPANHTEYERYGNQTTANDLLKKLETMGFREPKEHELFVVGLEYNLDNWGSPDDFDKLKHLQDFLHPRLYSRGLLFREGCSIGSGVMEYHVFTIDCALTKAMILEMVKGTEFSDYFRVFSGLASKTTYGLLHNPTVET